MDRKSHKRFGTPEPSCLSKPFGRDKMLNARRLRALLCPVSSAWLHPPSLKTHVPSARQTPSEEADSLPPPPRTSLCSILPSLPTPPNTTTRNSPSLPAYPTSALSLQPAQSSLLPPLNVPFHLGLSLGLFLSLPQPPPVSPLPSACPCLSPGRPPLSAQGTTKNSLL